MRAFGAIFLLSVLAASAGAQRTVADALRAPGKRIFAAELPEAFRAVAFGSDISAAKESIPAFSGLDGMTSGDYEKLRLLQNLVGIYFVDPDEFGEVLEGKRPRTRAYVFLPRLSEKMSVSALGRVRLPVPTFGEAWIEGGRIVTWSARSDISKAAIVKAFAPAAGGDQRGAKDQTLVNVKQAAVGILLYTADYDDQLPAANSTTEAQAAVMPYLKNSAVWRTANPNGGRLLYNTALSKVKTVSIERPSETLLLWDEKPWPDGSRVVAYADGHVMSVTKEQWEGIVWPAELRRRGQGK